LVSQKLLPVARGPTYPTDITAAMSQTIDPMQLMQRVTDRTLDLIAAADGVMVGLADGQGVTYVCGAGHRVSHLGTRVDLGSSLSGLAVRTGQVQRSDDTSVDPRVDAEACRRLSVASVVGVPLRRGKETLGVLAVNSRRARAFNDDDVALLSRLAEFVSVVIGSACDLERVHKHLVEITQPMVPSSTATYGGSADDAASRYVLSVLSPDTVARIDCGQRLRAALCDPQVMSMVFQPIIDVVNDEVVAVEALARFDVTPYRSPEVWFREAHENGFGVELELMAVTRALAWLPGLAASVTLAINAGPQTVMAPAFHEAVLGAPAHRVIVEVTEHDAIDDYPGLLGALRDLRQEGTRISIDDTGSGYSSLSHILKLAPDLIKLDRTLVSGIDLDPVRRALAAALVSFAAGTGAQIVAEGVETQDELAVLRQLGVRYAQGFYLGRPGGPETLLRLGRSP
jgi:EAL domain-containing protein (putative c-di-GMP-specific phosphodiesterase class I)